MFDTKEEASMRLDGTIIQGPSGPVYVKMMETRSRLAYRRFSPRGGLENTTKLAELDEGFSTKPFPLGYANGLGNCAYLQRMPVRKYKQGLHQDALRVIMNGGGDGPARHKNTFLYEGQGFYKMYHNNYPSLKEVRGMLEKDALSQAFHKEWSLELHDAKHHTLCYKAHMVGVYSRETGEFVLDEHRRYLQEALLEATI